MERPPTLDYAAAATVKGWPFTLLIAAVVLSLLLQTLFLSCLCPMGSVKVYTGLGVDAVIAGRMLLARHRRETGRGWIFYLVLGLTSVVWIPWAVGDW